MIKKDKKSFPIEEGEKFVVFDFGFGVAGGDLIFLTSSLQLFFEIFNFILQFFVLLLLLGVLFLKHPEVLLKDVIFLPQNSIFPSELIGVIVVLDQRFGGVLFVFTFNFVLFVGVLGSFAGDEEVHVGVRFVLPLYHILFCNIIQWKSEQATTDY